MKTAKVQLRVNRSSNSYSPDAASTVEKSTPTNQYLVDLISTYEKFLGRKLPDQIKGERSFILREVIPLALAQFNATEDARQVLEGVLPKASGYSTYQRMSLDALDLGLRIKLINRVASSLRLTEADRQLMLFTTLAPKELSLKDMLGGVSPPKGVNPLTNKARKPPRNPSRERP